MQKIFLMFLTCLFLNTFEAKGCNYSYEKTETANGGWMMWIYTSNGDMAGYVYWSPDGAGATINGSGVYSPTTTISGGLVHPTGRFSPTGSKKVGSSTGKGTLNVRIYDDALLACQDFRVFCDNLGLNLEQVDPSSFAGFGSPASAYSPY